MSRTQHEHTEASLWGELMALMLGSQKAGLHYSDMAKLLSLKIQDTIMNGDPLLALELTQLANMKPSSTQYKCLYGIFHSTHVRTHLAAATLNTPQRTRLEKLQNAFGHKPAYSEAEKKLQEIWNMPKLLSNMLAARRINDFVTKILRGDCSQETLDNYYSKALRPFWERVCIDGYRGNNGTLYLVGRTQISDRYFHPQEYLRNFPEKLYPKVQHPLDMLIGARLFKFVDRFDSKIENWQKHLAACRTVHACQTLAKRILGQFRATHGSIPAIADNNPAHSALEHIANMNGSVNFSLAAMKSDLEMTLQEFCLQHRLNILRIGALQYKNFDCLCRLFDVHTETLKTARTLNLDLDNSTSMQICQELQQMAHIGKTYYDSLGFCFAGRCYLQLTKYLCHFHPDTHYNAVRAEALVCYNVAAQMAAINPEQARINKELLAQITVEQAGLHTFLSDGKHEQYLLHAIHKTASLIKNAGAIGIVLSEREDNKNLRPFCGRQATQH